MPATKTRRKRCSECGELKHEVLGKQRLCEECEQNKDYCQVCDEFMDTSFGGGCRHLGWSDEHGCLCGCGTTHIAPDAHKESFVALLQQFHPLKDEDGNPLLSRMLAQIEANNFWTFWHGPMIGGPPDLDLRYEVPGRKDGWCTWFAQIPASVQLTWSDDVIDAMQLGMAWLTSLDSESTEANKITAGWIREFLSTETT